MLNPANHREQIVEEFESCKVCKLRRRGCLGQVSRAALEAFEAARLTAIYPQGTIVFKEGRQPRGVFVLCQGLAKLSLTSVKGKTLLLRMAMPGDVLGLYATVSGTAYEMTAELLQPSQLSFVCRGDFIRLLRDFTDVCLNVVRILADNCRRADQQIRRLQFSPSVREKVAHFLLEWSAQGEESEQGIRTQLGLSHGEIAELIGTCRESVSRCLGELRKHHYADKRASVLVIQNPAALEICDGL